MIQMRVILSVKDILIVQVRGFAHLSEAIFNVYVELLLANSLSSRSKPVEDRPKLVTFIDEAHLVFALKRVKALLYQTEAVVANRSSESVFILHAKSAAGYSRCPEAWFEDSPRTTGVYGKRSQSH
jgi:hypothetical protein